MKDEDDFGSQLSDAESWLDHVFDPGDDEPPSSQDDDDTEEESDEEEK